MLIYGEGTPRPGPGEPGFSAPGGAAMRRIALLLIAAAGRPGRLQGAAGQAGAPDHVRLRPAAPYEGSASAQGPRCCCRRWR